MTTQSGGHQTLSKIPIAFRPNRQRTSRGGPFHFHRWATGVKLGLSQASVLPKMLFAT